MPRPQSCGSKRCRVNYFRKRDRGLDRGMTVDEAPDKQVRLPKNQAVTQLQLHEDHVGIVAWRRGLPARDGVLANDILVQLDTQARPLRQLDLTFLDRRSTNE